jgi:hypothetical protein
VNGGKSTRSPATFVFLAVVVGAVVTVSILAVLGTLRVVEPIPNIPLTAVRVFGLVALVSGFMAAGMLSGRIPPLQTDQDEVSWWQANSQKAVVTWAAAEGIAVVGGVLFLLTADVVLLAALGGGGLLILLLNRPGRMMEG